MTAPWKQIDEYVSRETQRELKASLERITECCGWNLDECPSCREIARELRERHEGIEPIEQWGRGGEE